MTDHRPNPDALLARVAAEEQAAQRGKLKIFLGYAAGVGKTYAMLEAAHREQAAGVDVVVGYVETHGRRETESLVAGLELLPDKLVPHRGVTLREFDLDAALARAPQLILIDELAHSNAEGLRHAKRWQDVEELLTAGIDVYTTLNVQHIESLNDVIAQITGVAVRETLPDAVLEKADDFALVDITPEELIERLEAGKVYIPQQAQRALLNFFQPSNLTALRELSLREAANRLRRDVDAARAERADVSPWATSERLLVCVGPSPTTARLIRSAKRMAAAFGAQWLAVAVETSHARGGSSARQHAVAQHLRMAEQLGAQTFTLVGASIAETILQFAVEHNVTKIVVGKTAQPRWKRLLFENVVDQLLDYSGEIDVYVIQGEGQSIAEAKVPSRRAKVDGRRYLATACAVAVSTALGFVSHSLSLAEANTVMMFLLGVAWVAARYGRGPAVVASVASVLLFDFCFVPPYFTFAVGDAEYLITFAVMLCIGLVISGLTVRLREQVVTLQRQMRRTSALYQLTRQLSEVAGTDFLSQIAEHRLGEIFDGEAVVYTLEPGGEMLLRSGQQTSIARNPTNAIVAQWVAEHDQTAGLTTDTLPNATAYFSPLVGSQHTVGAIGIRPKESDRLLDPEERRLAATCASLVALSIERDRSLVEAHEAQLQMKAEQLRNSLLSSVSHDLRTPLAAIAGAGSQLISLGEGQASTTGRELTEMIVDEAQRMNRLVDNLLSMTQIEATGVRLNRQWHVLEEIVGSALRRLRKELADKRISVSIPADFPLLSLDALLVEQVFVNLLENAARYTPAGSSIEITGVVCGSTAEIHVHDNGSGVPKGKERQIFEKFVRGTAATPDGRRGAGWA